MHSLPHAREWFAKLPSKDKTLKIYEDWFHERTSGPLPHHPVPPHPP